MKKMLLTASALVFSMGIAHNAVADCNGLYLGMRAGVTKHYHKDDVANTKKLKYKDTFMLSGAAGYRYDYFRGELEYVWRDKIKKKSAGGPGVTKNLSFDTQSYMLNGYIDLAPYHWLTPYIGAGVGFTKLKFRETTYSEIQGGIIRDVRGNPTRFTWSVGGGLSVKVTNRFNVDAGYRYYDMGKVHEKAVTAHEIYGGVRYVF